MADQCATYVNPAWEQGCLDEMNWAKKAIESAITMYKKAHPDKISSGCNKVDAMNDLEQAANYIQNALALVRKAD
jgi:hypothetical protein